MALWSVVSSSGVRPLQLTACGSAPAWSIRSSRTSVLWLLYEKRFTIEGARKFLADRTKAEPRPAASGRKAARSQPKLFEEPPSELDSMRKELRAILDILK